MKRPHNAPESSLKWVPDPGELFKSRDFRARASYSRCSRCSRLAQMVDCEGLSAGIGKGEHRHG